ncbi:MAG: hypothetical protein O7J95_21885, partial [Planctomycetota bacterium]|nr:hypothetical protein [Planctomycetota bacterium]
MRLRFFAYACLFGILCGLPACDTGTPLTLIDDGDQVFVPDDTALPPVLTRVETPGSEGDPVCPGDVITMGGINFDRDLERNEVFFTAGNRRAKGLPLLVRLQPAEDGVNLTSFLDVVVPGGVSRGNVELVVRGQSAGAAGLDVCPLIVGFTMGLNEDAAVLPYNVPGNPPGFLDGASRLTVYGLSFTDVQEAILSDDSGNTRRVPANTFVRNPTAPAQGVEPTGLDSVAFNLRDEANDVRLPFSDERSNIGIFLRSARAESNRLEAPVSTGDIPEEIGLVITSVKVPVGVVTGPVRIHYTCYEFAVDAEWKIVVQFRASNDQFTSDWLNAKPIEDDSKIDGMPNLDEVLVTNLLAGSPRHRSGHRLLPGIGVMRTFVWDAPNDPIFRALNNERDSSGMSRARNWKVQFRLTPIPDTENRSFYTKTHRAETPPIVYYDLLDRPSGDVEFSRVAEFVEAFLDKQLEDRRASSAFWGPPINPGLLTGSTETDILDPFGEGTAVLELANIDPAVFLEPGEMILDEFIEFNTDRMEVVHRIFTDAGTPGDEGDDLELEFIEAYIDHEGNRVLNPGEEINEFHLAVLRIRPGTRVVGTGSLPLIIRLSGKTEDEQFLDDGVALHLELDAWIDLDGVDGGNSEGPGCPLPPNCGDRNGSGGRPGAGGGKGGDGATCTIFATTRYVRTLTAAERGENEGGGGGATPTALNFDAMVMLSIFHGEPGGGGGLATTGQDGDYMRAAIAQYEIPRLGIGGAVRGDAMQV